MPMANEEMVNTVQFQLQISCNSCETEDSRVTSRRSKKNSAPRNRNAKNVKLASAHNTLCLRPSAALSMLGYTAQNREWWRHTVSFSSCYEDHASKTHVSDTRRASSHTALWQVTMRIIYLAPLGRGHNRLPRCWRFFFKRKTEMQKSRRPQSSTPTLLPVRNGLLDKGFLEHRGKPRPIERY